MRSVIEIHLNGELVKISDMRPDTTLLTWLRLARRQIGTKEGCAEGDCGACTVFMRKRITDATGAFRDEMRAVNACILFLPMLDGAVIRTVEAITGPDGTPHPVQRAMIDHHGAQCGFCTPGFITSLYHLWRSGSDFSATEIDDGLAGNLCRCTGYGPIVAAAASLKDGAVPEWEPAIIAAEDAFLEAHHNADEALDYHAHGQRFIAPRQLSEAAAYLDAYPDATILSGGTDIGLWVTKQHRNMSCFLYMGRISEIAQITPVKNGNLIGAGVTHQQAMMALPDMPEDLYEIWRRFGSAQVRATGTVCGNIANGSPIGDISPCFLALGATLHLHSAKGERLVSLDEFFISYGKQNRQKDEIVSAVFLPRLGQNTQFHAFKISKRFDQDISAVLCAICLTIDDDRVVGVRIAFGGMAAIVKRALATEAALIGKTVSELAETDFSDLIAKDFTPLSDMRASSDYRITVAANLVRKVFLMRDQQQTIYIAGVR